MRMFRSFSNALACTFIIHFLLFAHISRAEDLWDDSFTTTRPGISKVYGSWIPTSTSRNGDAVVSEWNYGACLNVPLAQFENGLIFMKPKYAHRELQTESSSSSFTPPSSLDSLDFSLGYNHRWAPRQLLQITSGVGQQSDHILSSGAYTVGHAQAILVLPSGEQNAWIFSLTESTARDSFLTLPQYVPLPAIAYRWKISDNFILTIGIPTGKLFARLAPRWTLQMTYALASRRLISTLSARTDFRASELISLFASYGTNSQSYFLSDRVTDDDRFIIRESELMGGVRFWFSSSAALELGVGQSFGRSFINESLDNDTVSTLRLQKAWKGSAQLLFRF